MMMRYLLAFFSLFFLCNDLNASDHAYGGIPSGEAYLERKAYIINFDSVYKTPRWVAYYMKLEYLPAPDRDEFGDFRNDPEIEDEATENDYKSQFNTWKKLRQRSPGAILHIRR